MSSQTHHTADCRWEQTSEADCEYRATHHYCPHPEHACSCDAAARAALRVHIEAVEAAGYTVVARREC
jgi:hypothetical protein